MENHLDSHIPNWNNEINKNEFRELEYLENVVLEKLEEHIAEEINELYNIVSEHQKNLKKPFSKDSFFDGNPINISRKNNFWRTNKCIWTLFNKHWNKNISREKMEELKNMYFDSFYNEFFMWKGRINKPLLKSLQTYYMYKKQWDKDFEDNLWIFMSWNLAKKFEILWYLESYFWKNNSNKIAKWPFQFTVSTWSIYGLVDKKWHTLVSDDRNDPLKSAHATSKYLRNLFFYFLVKENKLYKSDILEYKKIKIVNWDTFSQLAKQYNVNTSVMIWFNKIMWRNVKTLNIWQEIYIPTKIKPLQSKINIEDIIFVLSMYNWWLYNTLKIKNIGNINEYMNILKDVYDNYKYIIHNSKSSKSLLSWINRINKIYFKKWRWLFTYKWKWIKILKYKSLSYKEEFILNHIQEIILQQSSYFWKFAWAVDFFNYLDKNKWKLKSKWLVFGNISRKIDLEHDNLADYLYGECLNFNFWKKWIWNICINTEDFTMNKLIKEFDWLVNVMWIKKYILVKNERYIVKKWDDIIKIWKRFKLEKKWIYLKQFILFNKLLTNNLQIWQVLYIPKRKYQLLSELSEYQKKKYLKWKLIKKLKGKYIIRWYNVIENTKLKKKLYILKK